MPTTSDATPEAPTRADSPDARELDDLVNLSSDLSCGSCGYQIATYTTPPECPMCRERNWQPITTHSAPQV
jgi:rubrerythrin